MDLLSSLLLNTHVIEIEVQIHKGRDEEERDEIEGDRQEDHQIVPPVPPRLDKEHLGRSLM